ncbi:hypothetical protein [Robertmurraya korlensis]|uniref:hypothetical protein n=1 Tax=Robertmurraya korlensis TaxID=519977 RepID=UPI000824FEE8|nr:hypothetical protein [Robertmurraya korlensis]
MNKFDARYDIRLARYTDIESIMKFINDYWREGHIMSKDRELFEYEFVEGDNVNFVLAIDRNTESIEGIFGFLNCSATNDITRKDIWGSLWKVVDDHDNIPLLGIELAKRVYPLTGCRTHIGNGANLNTTIPLRRIFFGEKVAKMKQYYFLNTEIENYNIAEIQEKKEKAIDRNKQNVFLEKFASIEDVKKNFNVENVDAIPYKDFWYINKRYFNHPYYTYDIYGLKDESGNTGALMMTRSITCNGGRILRIVDYIGEHKLFAGLGNQFRKLLQENDYEYIDFYTLGFKEEYIFDAGFKLRTEDDTNIIPNYFEPFVRENADIWAHYKIDGTLFFKADGDQDRPNEPKL